MGGSGETCVLRKGSLVLVWDEVQNWRQGEATDLHEGGLERKAVRHLWVILQPERCVRTEQVGTGLVSQSQPFSLFLSTLHAPLSQGSQVSS